MSSYASQYTDPMQQQQQQQQQHHLQQQQQQHQQQHHMQHNGQPIHTHRRLSLAHATAPYSIPQKMNNSINNGTNQPFSHSPHTGGPILASYNKNHGSSVGMPPMQSEYSTSLPLLSRDFVVRRISEGETGRLKEELKCEACGKGYKHISSLAKHLWEHTPEWNVTKKLLISKHQQVQLLELASILCSMTEPPLTPKTSPSRHPSDSPVDFDNVDPSTSNSSNSPSPFDNNNTQSQYTPSSTNTSLITGNGYNNNESHIKFRHNSISQYPPSTQLNSITSPQHMKPKTEGGYLDFVDQNNKNSSMQRKNSITSPDSIKTRDDDGLLNATSYNGTNQYLSSVPEQEFHQLKSFQNSYHHKNSVSTLTSEITLKNSDANEEDIEEEDGKTLREKDDDDGVFGAMD